MDNPKCVRAVAVLLAIIYVSPVGLTSSPALAQELNNASDVFKVLKNTSHVCYVPQEKLFLFYIGHGTPSELRLGRIDSSANFYYPSSITVRLRLGSSRISGHT